MPKNLVTLDFGVTPREAHSDAAFKESQRGRETSAPSQEDLAYVPQPVLAVLLCTRVSAGPAIGVCLCVCVCVGCLCCVCVFSVVCQLTCRFFDL